MKRTSITTFAIVTVVACLSVTAIANAEAAKSPETRNKIEELFIWKASEELKLAPKEEQAFTDIIREVNSQKRNASERMEAANKELESAKTAPDAERALKNHRKALQDIQNLQLSEIDRLKKLLGAEKLARYLVVKATLTDRLKTMISSPSATPTPPKSNQ